jgi:hypothetical protein
MPIHRLSAKQQGQHSRPPGQKRPHHKTIARQQYSSTAATLFSRALLKSSRPGCPGAIPNANGICHRHISFIFFYIFYENKRKK